MKQEKQDFNYKSGVVRINESLNKYDDVVLFPKKVEAAKEHLKRIGLPKEITNPQNSKQDNAGYTNKLK